MVRLVIFDLDGTLTQSGKPMSPQTASALEDLLQRTDIAVISGAVLKKIELQVLSMLSKKAKLQNLILLPQNGSHCFENKGGVWNEVYGFDLNQQEKEEIFSALEKIYETEKPNTAYPPLVTDKGGQITYSPVGIEAPTEAKRAYDADHSKREKIAQALRQLLPDFEIGIGGRASIDITRKGLGKAFGVTKVLGMKSLLPAEAVFVGDALFAGGNDNPVRATGIRCFQVRGPEETEKIIANIVDRRLNME